MIYKIGRYYYKEISEERWCKIWDKGSEGVKILATLIDYDGEPIKYLIKVSKCQKEGQKR